VNVSYEISAQELSAELLPAREALGGHNWSDVWADNTATALNFGDFGGSANALAVQNIEVTQKN
jgi:hypothetical protein